MERLEDVSDRFVFLEEELAYGDGPLEGFVRCKRTGSLYAFRVFGVIPDVLIHWTLIPVESTRVGVEACFSSAAIARVRRWISIVEDSRDGPPSASVAV